MKKLLILILALAFSAGATTYYCDFAGGADANAGTSTGASWKRAPYMRGWAGAGAVDQYGQWSGHSTSVDTFVFKGNVQWDSTCFTFDCGDQNKTFTVEMALVI